MRASDHITNTGGSIVAVGDGFKPSMLEPAEFFGGLIDQELTVVQEDAACRFSYDRGKYRLSIMPDRVTVETNEPVLSKYLVSNTERLFGMLDSYKGAVSVPGWGMNYYATFSLGITRATARRSAVRSTWHGTRPLGGLLEAVAYGQ